MDLLKNIIFGFVTGITEFLPVSSGAHQGLFYYIFGITTRDSVQNLLVHIGVFLSVVIGYHEVVSRLQREQKNIVLGRRRARSLDNKTAYDLRLMKTATVPMLIGLILYFATYRWEHSLPAIMAFLLLNGLSLLLADHAPHGNKDARSMTGLDGIVMGVLGALSALPGISRTGMITSYATLRGADRQHSGSWAIVLALPAMIFAIVFDFYGIFAFGVGGLSFVGLLGSILSGVAAFCGGYIGISVLQTVMRHSGFSGFALYSFGASLLAFILYLFS